MNVQEFDLLKEHIVITRAFEVILDNRYSLNENEIVRGRLAVSLEFFDFLMENCSSHGCYQLSENSMQFIDNLSLDECIRHKAYHNWKKNGKPYPTNQEERLSCYLDSESFMQEWCEKPCLGECNVAHMSVNNNLKNNKSLLLEKKGYWYHLADPTRTWERNSMLAKEYLNALTSALSNKNTSDEICNLALEYKEVMSVYEFMALSCRAKRTKSAPC